VKDCEQRERQIDAISATMELAEQERANTMSYTKLCIHCDHYVPSLQNAFNPPGPTCHAPQAPVRVNPVHGGKTYSDVYLMRMAETKPRCGMDAAWFVPKTVQKPAGPRNRLIQWWRP